MTMAARAGACLVSSPRGHEIVAASRHHGLRIHGLLTGQNLCQANELAMTGRFDQMQEARDVSTLTQGMARVRHTGETRRQGDNRQGEQSPRLWRSNGMKQGRFAREQDQKNWRRIKKLLVTHDCRKDTASTGLHRKWF